MNQIDPKLKSMLSRLIDKGYICRLRSDGRYECIDESSPRLPVKEVVVLNADGSVYALWHITRNRERV